MVLIVFFFNRLGVSILNKPQFTNEVEGLFGVFDGGRNDEVIKIIDDVIRDTVLEEARQGSANQNSLKYAMLSIHRLEQFSCVYFWLALLFKCSSVILIIFLVKVSNLSVNYTATSFLLLFSLNIKLKESLNIIAILKRGITQFLSFFFFSQYFLNLFWP